MKNHETPENLPLLEPAKRPLLTKSQYAAHRGVSPSAVTRACREDRVVLVRVNGRDFVDKLSSDLLWDGLTRPRIDAPGPDAPRAELDDVDLASSSGDLKAARLRRELAAATMLEIDLDQRCGMLVERVEVEFLIRDLAEAVRTKLEATAGTLAPLLIGHQGDEAAIRAAVRDHMHQLLSDLGEHFKRQAANHLPAVKERDDAEKT